MAEFATKEKVKENRTGIPVQLKERVEQRTGLSFDDVRVHYNSDKPAKLGAFAYTQGNQVEIGPGQERHLPHELGHVVQQKLGLVRANAMHPRGVAMNTEEGLERQADEIGAGERISMSASGNNGAGIVQRYRILGDYTFAQAPSGEKNSKVMVKNGEPASIYFDETAITTVQADEILNRLGITKTGESIKFDDHEEDQNSQGAPFRTRTFFRFGQGRIPNIGKVQPYDYDKVIQEGSEQPLRPQEKLQEAFSFLQKQYEIIDALLHYAKMFQNNMINRDAITIAPHLNELTSNYINICKKGNDSNEYIAITSLGYDIILSMYTLRSITNKLKSKPPVVIDDLHKEYEMLNAKIGNVPEEVVQRYRAFPESDKIAHADTEFFAFLLAKEFLDKVDILLQNIEPQALFHKINTCVPPVLVKYKQLVQKKEIPQIIHLIEEFCSFFDNMLALEIAIEELEYRHKQVNEEEKLIRFIPILPTGCDTSANYRQYYSSSEIGIANLNRQDMSAVHWQYHYVTPISLPSSIIGPHDRLFIEDAVGKSSHSRELANAHWAAHIYGQRENEPMSQQGNTQQNEWKELDCRFNKLSVGLRSTFFEKKKMHEDSSLTINYMEKGHLGSLQIVVKNNILKYQFSPGAAPYVQHFEMDLAKTLANEFVQQAVNIEHMEQLEIIRENSAAYELAASGKVYAIENIRTKDLTDGLKKIKKKSRVAKKEVIGK